MRSGPTVTVSWLFSPPRRRRISASALSARASAAMNRGTSSSIRSSNAASRAEISVVCAARGAADSSVAKSARMRSRTFRLDIDERPVARENAERTRPAGHHLEEPAREADLRELWAADEWGREVEHEITGDQSRDPDREDDHC